MKAVAGVLIGVIVVLSALEANAVGSFGCIKLGRRQRQLTTRDDFPGATCSLSSINADIRSECRAGLCRPLRRAACKRALRKVLVEEIFPARCGGIVTTTAPVTTAPVTTAPVTTTPPVTPKPCVSIPCTGETCRSTVDLTLNPPFNCRETCIEVAVGECFEARCFPVVPDCVGPTEFNAATCQCDPVDPPECTRDNECPSTNACRRGVCSDAGECLEAYDGTCCINDRNGLVPDTECTSSSPVCGSSSGSTVDSGETGNACFFCEDDRGLSRSDNGCTDATKPFCAASNGVSVGTDGLGEACFSCQFSAATTIDTGCESATRFCGRTIAGLPVSEGNYGDTCFSCINDSDGIDSGCSSTTPNCNVPSGLLGNSCVSCVNSAPGGGVDIGCTEAQPICATSATPTSDIGVNVEGSFCVECIDDGASSPAIGCSTSARFCSAGAKCSFCEAVPGTDAGCPGTAPLCVGADGLVVADTAGGEQCAFCVNTSSPSDPGCGGATPICMAENGQAGTMCVACQNDRSGNNNDLGCPGDPRCGIDATTEAPIDGFGSQCLAAL